MVQIDGLSGTGKTTLAAELALRGYHAIDTDAAFAYFADPVTGAPTEVETRANWMWDGQRLREFAHASRHDLVFLCGGAMNQNEFIDLFTKQFTLCIDDDTMRERLLTRINNGYGKDSGELAEQLELNQSTVEYAQGFGSIVVDATRPIDEVADNIVSMTLEMDSAGDG